MNEDNKIVKRKSYRKRVSENIMLRLNGEAENVKEKDLKIVSSNAML